MYKLIALDLDGTLTQHRTKIDEYHKNIIQKLNNYKVIMVVAGSCARAFDQLDRLPLDIIGNYGLQESIVQNGELKIIKNDQYMVDKDDFNRRAEYIRKETGFTHYDGDSLEYHDSGLVTFPLLGTKAKLEDKLAFDPKGEKRSKIYPFVSNMFSEYNCFIGGSSSFDIVSKKYNKAKALKSYCEKHKISSDTVLFVGDDFKKGGNDESIVDSGFDYIVVEDYSKLEKYLVQVGVLN